MLLSDTQKKEENILRLEQIGNIFTIKDVMTNIKIDFPEVRKKDDMWTKVFSPKNRLIPAAIT